MNALTTCVCLIVLSVSVSAQLPYEDDPANFAWQRASDVTGVGERLYVKARSRLLHEILPCYAMLRLLQNGVNAFSFAVSHIKPGRLGGLNRYATRLVTSRTPHHPHQNAVAFHLTSGSPRMTRFKVMYSDPGSNCIILIKFPTSRHRECILLQTSSTVDQPIPPECRKVYMIFCNFDSVYVYQRGCKGLLRNDAV
uniref:Lipocalin n=1 Tax=Rhipicephalus appendiculatus TaxID=34631 RepID=A0A131YVM8_RHIAP